MYQLILTTNGGLEDIVEEEFRERADLHQLPYESLETEPFDLGGRVRIETDAPPETAIFVANSMRSIHHVLRYIYEFEIPATNPLETIESSVHNQDLPEVDRADTFRITSNRYGEHAFTSVDIQRASGAAVDRKYDASVDLENFDVEVRVDVHDQTCMVGIQNSETALSKRHPRKFTPVASLKTTVAYAMLKLARIEEHNPNTLLDPFCGGATILLEAAEVYPGIELRGSDRSQKAVTGARQNFRAAGLPGAADIQKADARRLAETYARGMADLIVTNPPFGMRLEAGMDFEAFYRDVLGQFVRTLGPDGRIVMLVHKRGVFREAVGNYPQLEIRHVRIVETGGLYPGIFVLQKRR